MTQTFYKITNKQIYDKLEKIDHELSDLKHSISTTRWIATTSLSLTCLVIGYIIQLKIT